MSNDPSLKRNPEKRSGHEPMISSLMERTVFYASPYYGDDLLDPERAYIEVTRTRLPLKQNDLEGESEDDDG